MTTRHRDEGHAPEMALHQFAEAVDGLAPVALRVAATLRLADRIVAGHDDLASLAEDAEVDSGALRRLMAFLTCREIFAEPHPGVFALTELSTVLLDGHPAHLRGWLDGGGIGARMDHALAHLEFSVRTGRPAYPHLHGSPFYEDLAAPDGGDSFDRLRAHHAEGIAEELPRLNLWKDVEHVVDVGGGGGVIAAGLLRAHAGLRVSLVDLPAAVDQAIVTLADPGLSRRFTPCPGSFFDPLPERADTYLLVNVLHNWDDEQAAAILSRCVEASRGKGRVLVCERPVDDTMPHAATAMDLRMLVFMGGKERSMAQFRMLAATAGLKMRRVDALPSGLQAMEFRIATSS